MIVTPLLKDNFETAAQIPAANTMTIPAAPFTLGLLLAEANAESLSRRSRLFSQAGYKVTAVSGYQEICALRVKSIRIAVISNSLTSTYLRLTAQIVRRQWPLAHILIIGPASDVLDDALYEEAVDRRITDEHLLTTVLLLWSHLARYSSQSSSAKEIDMNPSGEPDSRNRWSPVESDPSKAPRETENEGEDFPDYPAGERRGSRP